MSSEHWHPKPETISPSAIYRLSRVTQTRNPEELGRLIYGDAQYAQDRGFNQRDLRAAQEIDVPIYGDLETASPETQQLSQELQIFCQLAAWRFQQQFLDQVRQLQSRQVALPAEMAQTLKSPEQALPHFSLHFNGARAPILEKTGVGDITSLLEESAVLVFNLPAALEDFWSKPIWSELYVQLMRVIWHERNTSERMSQQLFRRLNPEGQHVHGSYYYVWEVLALSTFH